jgi:hypothetical protein
VISPEWKAWAYILRMKGEFGAGFPPRHPASMRNSVPPHSFFVFVFFSLHSCLLIINTIITASRMCFDKSKKKQLSYAKQIIFCDLCAYNL